MADFILDRAYFAEMTELAKKQGDSFLMGYVKVMIDAANLRTAVRTVRMNKGQDFLLQALIAGGNVSPDKLAQAAVSADGLAALFTATVLYNAAVSGLEAMKGGSMTKFELACDNAVTAYLSGAKLVSFGSQAVIKYLALVEAETTAVRMILSGKMAGIAPNVIRERLREIDA
jgi:V/A-type H+-transporting ATPase subunit C